MQLSPPGQMQALPSPSVPSAHSSVFVQTRSEVGVRKSVSHSSPAHAVASWHTPGDATALNVPSGQGSHCLERPSQGVEMEIEAKYCEAQ